VKRRALTAKTRRGSEMNRRLMLWYCVFFCTASGVHAQQNQQIYPYIIDSLQQHPEREFNPGLAMLSERVHITVTDEMGRDVYRLYYIDAEYVIKNEGEICSHSVGITSTYGYLTSRHEWGYPESLEFFVNGERRDYQAELVNQKFEHGGRNR
jgi:hypothetical protein